MSSSETVQDFEPVRASRPSGGAAHEFRVVAVNASGGTSTDTRITVRDGWDGVSAEAYGELVTTLPQGLYTVHLERAGVVAETVVRHTAGTSVREAEPKRASALPSFDTADAHEYYSYTAAEISTRVTGNAAVVLPDDGHGMGRLFVFVRAAARGAHDGRDLADALSLYSLDGERLTDFGPDVVEQHDVDGWMAFSAPARAGTYVLRSAGLGAREMVVSVFAGWETQLFIPFEHRPRLERSSVLMAPVGMGFNPDDRISQASDAGLSGLRAGINLLPPETRELLLHGKFENPMLGLIGAHLLLLQPEPDWGLVDIVIQNLDQLLPGAADVHAIRLAAALRYGDGPPLQPVDSPPMLQRGLVAVMDASAVRPEIVPEGGFIERIAPQLLADSAWTTWSVPEPALEQPSPQRRSRMADDAAGSPLETDAAEEADMDPGGATRSAASLQLPEWVRSLLLDARKRGASRDLASVARDARLPLGMLQRAYNRLD